MSICTSCQRGNHQHDKWGPNAPEVRRGDQFVGNDAGCPNSADGRDCKCNVVVYAPHQPQPHCSTCRCGGAR